MADMHTTTRRKKYTIEEEKLIKENYPNLDLLVNLLPNHSRKAIILKARNMGLSKKINKRFTEYEDNILKKYYSGNGAEYIINNFMKYRTVDEIHGRTSKLGLKFITYNKDYFETIDSHEKAYWLGFFYTDGYVCCNDNRVGIELNSEDDYMLKNLLNLIDSNMKVKYRKRKNKFNNKNKDYLESCSITFNNRKLHDDLINKGVLPNKTKILKFPNNNIVDEKYMFSFIRGLIDGDGSICLCNNNNGYKKPHISFISASYDFINGLKYFLYKYNIKINITTNKNGLYRMITEKQSDVFRLLNLLYKDSNENCRLERKYKKYIEIKNYYSLT